MGANSKSSPPASASESPVGAHIFASLLPPGPLFSAHLGETKPDIGTPGKDEADIRPYWRPGGVSHHLADHCQFGLTDGMSWLLIGDTTTTGQGQEREDITWQTKLQETLVRGAKEQVEESNGYHPLVKDISRPNT